MENLRTIAARIEERQVAIAENIKDIKAGLSNHVKEDKENFKHMEGKLDKLVPFMIIIGSIGAFIGWVMKGFSNG